MAAGPLSSRRSVSRAKSFPKGRTCSKSFSYSWSGLKQEKLDPCSVVSRIRSSIQTESELSSWRSKQPHFLSKEVAIFLRASARTGHRILRSHFIPRLLKVFLRQDVWPSALAELEHDFMMSPNHLLEGILPQPLPQF